jgi:hypothetical protein
MGSNAGALGDRNRALFQRPTASSHADYQLNPWARGLADFRPTY